MRGFGYPVNVTGAPAARNHLKEVAMKTLLSFFVLGLLSLSSLPAQAQRVATVDAYPTKPVKVIVPRPPGNANDLIARVLVQKFSESMGGQFYVENLPAGGGIVGMATAASAPADGHTILAANQDLIVHPLVKGKVPYDPFRSFAPVSLLAAAPEVIVVHPSVPAKDIKELIALLKANPGKYSYASPGHGTSPHVACERLFRITHGVDAVHVPFPGGGQAVQSTLAGHTAILHITLPLIAQHIKDGSLRALALASSKRSPLFPDLPTLAEAGVPNHEVAFWVGMLVPAGTPSSRIDALHQQITRIQSLADVKERYASIGFEPVGSTPDQFAAHLKRESGEWARVVREARLTID
jgi:tripartite-type tricarboxylate transporter receptor subunit TctC